MKARVVVFAVSGEKFYGDWEESNQDKVGEFSDCLKRVGELTYLTLNIDGDKVHFNPANIVAVKLETL